MISLYIREKEKPLDHRKIPPRRKLRFPLLSAGWGKKLLSSYSKFTPFYSIKEIKEELTHLSANSSPFQQKSSAIILFDLTKNRKKSRNILASVLPIHKIQCWETKKKRKDCSVPKMSRVRKHAVLLPSPTKMYQMRWPSPLGEM